MEDTQHRIGELYSFFNARDVDACLALMTEDVQWPKASEGGRVTGKDEVRAYWKRQWAEFDPHVEPVKVLVREGQVDVTVRQIVKAMDGSILFDGIVKHIFTLSGGLVTRMDIAEAGVSSEGESAFRRK